MILFAVIAMREVVFFANVAQHLKEKHGHESMFLTFYQAGDDYLRKRGFHVASLHSEISYVGIEVTEKAVKEFERRHGIPNIRDLTRHERLTHGRYDEAQAVRKVLAYERYLLKVLRAHEIRCCMQELGGFVAPLALYYCSLHEKVPHVFFEPSMYKGMLFFNYNSLDVKLEQDDNSDERIRESVKEYIQRYRREKIVLAPGKDSHHFKDMGFRKLFAKRNVIQLLTKLSNKYFHGYAEEYDAIWHHVCEHGARLIARGSLSRMYSEPSYTMPYVYFPLHVPMDFQLTVRSNRYLDQISLIEHISDLLPFGHVLYIKEHPASIGAYSSRRLARLLSIRRNIKLIRPTVNSYDLIEGSQLVITINSKAGVEALMQGRKVIVLGKTYYASAPRAIRVSELDELGSALTGALCRPCPEAERDIGFFCRVFASSTPGELYDNSPSNVQRFAESVANFLRSTKTSHEAFS